MSELLAAQFAPKRQLRGSVYRKCQTITCDGCGAEDRVWPVGEPLPVQGMAAHFARRGWAVKKSGKHLCGRCSGRKSDKEGESMTKVQEVVSQAAREARRMAHMLIEENYQSGRARYAEGYSDERIAKECGVSVEWVNRRREDEFGPLKTGPDLAGLRAAILDAEAALRAAFDALGLAAAAVKAAGDKVPPEGEA